MRREREREKREREREKEKEKERERKRERITLSTLGRLLEDIVFARRDLTSLSEAPTSGDGAVEWV